MKKKKAKKKSAFRKRRNIEVVPMRDMWINYKDIDFFRFIAKASREGRL